MGIFGGLFGRKPYMGAQIREDANAPKLTDLLGQSTGETQQPWNTQPQALPQKPGLFGQGGKAWDVIGGTADALIQMRGGKPIYDDGSKRRLQEAILQAQIAQQTHQANRQFDVQNPMPDDYDRELAANGIYPGTPEYAKHRANRLKLKDDPVHMIQGPDGGPILVGGPYGYPGQPQQQDDGYDELPPGYQIGGGEGGPYQPAPTQSTYSNVVDPAGEAAMIKTLGRAGYEQWKRKYGLQVTGNR